jgi:hypothetical protein
MTIFDLLFLACAFATVVILVQAAGLAVRGEGRRALAKLRKLGIGAAVYMGVVLAVAAASPREIYRIGDTRCFDDWCIAVTGARRTGPGAVEVALRLSSRAKRVPQGEKGTVVYLVDSGRRRYDPVQEGGGIPFDTLLQPGESVDTMRRFAVPVEQHGLDLVYTHEGGFPIGFFIIGENHWFHGPAVVPLESVDLH